MFHSLAVHPLPGLAGSLLLSKFTLHFTLVLKYIRPFNINSSFLNESEDNCFNFLSVRKHSSLLHEGPGPQWAVEVVVLRNGYIVILIVIFKEDYLFIFLNLNVFKNSEKLKLSNENE